MPRRRFFLDGVAESSAHEAMRGLSQFLASKGNQARKALQLLDRILDDKKCQLSPERRAEVQALLRQSAAEETWYRFLTERPHIAGIVPPRNEK